MKKEKDAKAVRGTLEHWKKDSDLTGLRDETDVAKLSADEQAACRALWRDVQAALEHVNENGSDRTCEPA